MAWLHQHGEVLHQESEGMETRLLVRIDPPSGSGSRRGGERSKLTRG
jgi:hypothetical protein